MASELDLFVDRESEVPLGTQLAWRVRTLIASGALAPGARLPGVRELAESAGVNVNTVRSVYARLEEQGLVASEHGRGTFVAPDAPRRAGLAEVATAAAEQARAAGIDPRDLAAALFVSAPSSPADPEAEPPPPSPGGRGRGEAARRRQLRDQIAQLERDLAHVEGLTALPASPPPAPAGRILTAAELESIRDDLVLRLEAARNARADARRRAAEQAREPMPETVRVWRHGGVWTGGTRPGVVRTASFGA